MEQLVKASHDRKLINRNEFQLYTSVAKLVDKAWDSSSEDKITVPAHYLMGLIGLGFHLGSTDPILPSSDTLVHQLVDESLVMDKEHQNNRFLAKLAYVLGVPYTTDMKTLEDLVNMTTCNKKLEWMTIDIKNFHWLPTTFVETVKKFEQMVETKITHFPVFKRLDTVDSDWIKTRLTHIRPNKKANLHPSYDGKIFLSIDLIKANATTLFHLLPYLFGLNPLEAFGRHNDMMPDLESGLHRWELLVNSLTKSHVLRNSKQLRQKLLGSICDRKNDHGIILEQIITDGNKHLISQFANRMRSALGDPMVVMVDELLYELDEPVVPKIDFSLLGEYTRFCRFYRVQTYRLLMMNLPSGQRFFVKEFLDGSPIEIKGINKRLHLAAKTHYYQHNVEVVVDVT